MLIKHAAKYLLFNNPEQAENLKRRVVFILRNKNEMAMRSSLSNACSLQRCKTPVGCEVKRLSVHGGCLAVRGDEGRANLRKATVR